MPRNRRRITSVTFRRFKERHASLSTLYWTHILCAKGVEKQLQGCDAKSWSVAALGIEMDPNEFGCDVATALSSIEGYLDTCRLHILAISLAQLESFLKEFAFCVAKIRDVSPEIGQLSPMAEAMAAPIRDVDSLPGPLKYSQHFFGVDIDAEIKQLTGAYNYRCAAVHNGGYATQRALKKLGRGGIRLNDKLAVSWADLKPILAAEHHVADLIDLKWSGKELHRAECELELKHLQESKLLPPRSEVWGCLDKSGFRLPTKTERDKIAKYFYNRDK